MTINLLTITDPHFAGVGPKAYLPNPATYKLDALSILAECAQLAKEHNCAAVLIPGDLTNSHIMSTAVLREFAEALRKFPCLVLTVAGNHDRENSDLEGLKAAPYGVLEAAGVIQNASNEGFNIDDKMMWHLPDNFMVSVVGHPHDENTDYDISGYGFDGSFKYCTPSPVASSRVTVILTHGMLLPDHPWWAKDNPENKMRYTTFEQLAQYPAGTLPDIIVNGHYHGGHEATYLPNGTLIVNYGAVCRLSRDVGEIKRVLKVGLVTIEGPGKYRAEPIILKSQRPGHECLNREELEREVERAKTKDKMGEFLSLLGTKREIRVRDARVVIGEAVEELGKAGKLIGVDSIEIKERCLARLDRVSGAMEAREEGAKNA